MDPDLAQLIAELPPELAEPVFTHTSWVSERSAAYERLEFLGDSVLELWWRMRSTCATRTSPRDSSPRCARTSSRGRPAPWWRASSALASVSSRRRRRHRDEGRARAPLPQPQRAGGGHRGGARRGLPAARFRRNRGHAVVAAFSDQIEHALTSRVDHKTDLQELLARTGRQVAYLEISVEGPPHERRFTCAATIDGEELGRGEGGTKKAAEQEAAREALDKLDNAAVQ